MPAWDSQRAPAANLQHRLVKHLMSKIKKIEAIPPGNKGRSPPFAPSETLGEMSRINVSEPWRIK
jgi:hypothetical protein